MRVFFFDERREQPPAFVRFGPRIAEEGYADVPTTWARGEA